MKRREATIFKKEKNKSSVKIDKKFTGFDFIALISGVGIIAWFISDFFIGMFFIALVFWWVLIPILILYGISIISTLISLLKKGKRVGVVTLIAHELTFSVLVGFYLYESDIFKSKHIMTAVLKDDLFHYRLVFRKNGVVENQINGFLGYSQTITGKYQIKDSLIIFSKKPYTNDFIPDTLLLDKKQKAIFLNKDKNGNFDTAKTWLNYFEIESFQ